MGKIIAVDFDGTIAKTSGIYVKEVYSEAALYIRKWRKAGHQVVLWTCREGDWLDVALAACIDAGIQFDGVNENVIGPKKFAGTSRKIHADYYIDDKCPMPVGEQWHAVNQMLGGR